MGREIGVFLAQTTAVSPEAAHSSPDTASNSKIIKIKTAGNVARCKDVGFNPRFGREMETACNDSYIFPSRKPALKIAL